MTRGEGKWQPTWTEEPDRLQFVGALRAGHNLATTPPSPPPDCGMEKHKLTQGGGSVY